MELCIFLKLSLFFLNIACFFYTYTQNIDYIRSLENQALKEIKIAYNIEESVWNTFLGHISNLRNEVKTLLTQTNSNVKHDVDMPQEKLNIIYDIFKQQNINPQSIHIIVDHELEKSNTRALMHMKLFSYASIEKYTIKDPMLKISPKILQDSHEAFKATIYHELGHLFEVHGFMEHLIESACAKAPADRSVEKEMIKNNLNRVHEFIADQYFASQDKNIALILEKHLKPNPLYNSQPLPEKWYPTVPERWASFAAMKNKVYGNATSQHIL